jgi:competence protein ComEA
MTQQSDSREFWLLRRGDQAVVAATLVSALIVSLAWWTLQGGWRGTFVEVDRAEPRPCSFKVDINRADWPELAQLPDIGEVTARKIAASRESEGPFANIDDLKRVHGIGPKTVERIRPYLLPIEERPR